MKRITKILLLTFVLSMLIIPTCFASDWSSEPLEITDEEFKNIISSKVSVDVSQENFNTYTGNYSYDKVTGVIFKSTYHKLFYKAGDNLIYVFYYASPYTLTFNYDHIELPYYMVVEFNLNSKTINTKNVQGQFTWSTTSLGVTTDELKSFEYQQDLMYDTFFYVAGSLNSSSGSSLIKVPEEPDNTLSFPDTGYSYWEGLIHNANDITYAIMLVSDDSFTADDFLLSASGDKIRFSASSDKDIQYFIRVYTLNKDKSWTFGSGSSYNGKTMSHVANVGGIVMTTKNIVNEDGSIFFPLTPAVPLEQLGAKIVEVMAKITIVAVSLLALWISLIVLLKVLKTYLT